jgi:hypothetical protein
LIHFHDATLKNVQLLPRDGGWKLEFHIPAVETSLIPELSTRYQRLFDLRISKRTKRPRAE